MLKNYLLIAWRSLRKSPVFSFINVAGLAIGLAVCMLMMEYVAHEHSYDKFHKNADNICWVQSKILINNDSFFMPAIEYKTAQMVKDRVPAVESFVRLKKGRDKIVFQNNVSPSLRFAEGNVMFADSNFFNFFSFRLLAGSKNDVLSKPYQVVISQKAAKKYFGDENPVGKTLRADNTDNFVVSGVVENTPSNSSITYDVICSASTLRTFSKDPELKNGGYATYFLLRQPADAIKVEAALTQIAKEEQQGDVKISTRYITTMLPETHLSANYGDTSNTKYLSVFPLVAALILILAVINYSSLSTARAAARAKEIGVRKVLGAGRKTIAVQFFTESAMLTAICFIIGYILCAICQPVFFHFLAIDIDNSFLYSPYLLLSFGGVFIVAVLLAALYPAIVLSSFTPLQVLYSRFTKQKGGLTLRRVFTVFQFTIAVVLIICGLIIQQQMQFIRHADTGVNRSNIVMVPFTANAGKHYPALKRDVQSLASVQLVGTCSNPMYKGYNITVIPQPNSNDFITLPNLEVDGNFIPMLGLRWKSPPTDSGYRHKGMAVLNEAAVEKLGIKGNPVNKVINDRFTVAGVVNNFNYSSLEYRVNAMVLFFNTDDDTASNWIKNGGCLFVKTKAGTNIPSLLDNIKAAYEKYDAAAPFEYTFMDDAFNNMYTAEDKLSKIFTAFTLFTVLIACLGLFGMSIFAASQRIKEIGIRKVLGADVLAIVSKLSSDFLKPVIIAVVIALPIGWYCMQQWLKGFAYRSAMPWWLLPSAAAITILIALLTISMQVLKAATVNPVKSLRSE